MKNISVVILGGGTPEQFHLPVDDNFSAVSKSGVIYKASSIYRIEVDWKGNETTLYTTGEVVEFTSAAEGMELLRAISSGERRYIAPNSSRGEIENDD